MLLQLNCKYLQNSVPGFGSLMGPIEEALREILFPPLLEVGGGLILTSGKSQAILLILAAKMDPGSQQIYPI